MSTATIPQSISSLPDADMQAAPAALARAAQRARELAARSGTPLIYAENGEVVERIVKMPAEDRALPSGD
jgi:hypothetical protein